MNEVHVESHHPISRDHFTVMTFNIAHGRGSSFNQIFVRTRTIKRNLNSIAAYLKAESPDIVGLQEVDEDADWSGNINQVAYIAERAGYPYFEIGVNNKKEGKLKLKYGNAILSKFPIIRHENHPFGDSKLGEKGFLVADIQLYEQKVTVAVVHLDFKFSKNRKKQIKKMIKRLKDSQNSLIVLGDFNCTLNGKEDTLEYLERALDLKALENGNSENSTYPAKNPRKRIDHVFVNPSLKITSLQSISIILSDHLPVLTEITYNNSSAVEQPIKKHR